MPTLIRTLLAVAAAAVPASAQDLTAPLPPELPWHGASERLIAAPNDPWITPSEAAGFDITPSYDQTRAWLDRLDAESDLISIETFGRTAQGRELYAVRAAKPGASHKPVLLAQAGIHSGEIDGKDAATSPFAASTRCSIAPTFCSCRSSTPTAMSARRRSTAPTSAGRVRRAGARLPRTSTSIAITSKPTRPR
jgi:hypothetical protein